MGQEELNHACEEHIRALCERLMISGPGAGMQPAEGLQVLVQKLREAGAAIHSHPTEGPEDYDVRCARYYNLLLRGYSDLLDEKEVQ